MTRKNKKRWATIVAVIIVQSMYGGGLTRSTSILEICSEANVAVGFALRIVALVEGNSLRKVRFLRHACAGSVLAPFMILSGVTNELSKCCIASLPRNHDLCWKTGKWANTCSCRSGYSTTICFRRTFQSCKMYKSFQGLAKDHEWCRNHTCNHLHMISEVIPEDFQSAYLVKLEHTPQHYMSLEYHFLTQQAPNPM